MNDNTKTVDNIQKTESIDNTNSIIEESPIKKYGRGQNPNSKKNLISLADRTREERIEIGKKGGIKSGETKRNQKNMRETLQDALKIELSKKKIQSLGIDEALLNGDNSVLSVIIASTIKGAVDGDPRLIQFIRDSIGEKPIDETHNINETITADDVSLIDNMKRSLIG